MYKQFIYILIACVTVAAQAQTTTGTRYKDFIFKDVRLTKDVTYSPGDIKDIKKAHLFDLYQPAGDNSTKRPLIIWMHGGGFKFGSKDAAGIKLWSETFARRGYVCVALNYTLSKHYPIFHFDELLRSSYYAVQDARKAIAFFKKNASLYGIDPDKIILAGNSAGGIIALQTAYTNNVQLAKLTAVPDTAEGTKDEEMTHVAGVINFWGGIFDLNWLKNARVPIVSAHGTEDGTLSPTHKDAPLYGSISIHEKADELKLPNGLKLFKGYSHELQKHFNPVFGVGKGTQERWLEAGQYAADFLYTKVLK